MILFYLACIFRGIPAGYSDGKRPRFRAKSAAVPTGKRPLLSRSSERWPAWLGKLRVTLGNLGKTGYRSPSEIRGRRRRCRPRGYRCERSERFSG